ncbi:MAG: DUF1801 domain-containing protein [Bryobacteraceae bacterium]
MTSSSKSVARPRTIDEYLLALSPEKRAALEQLRTAIRAATSGADECISYGLPAFRLEGKFLLAFGAAARHCAFYPGSVVQRFDKELKDYETSTGTIRFQPHKPLPCALVRKLVKARIAERPQRLRAR